MDTKSEDAWQQKATGAAIEAVRKIALNSTGLPTMTPVGRLTDTQWGWLVTAALFAWIRVRHEQAIAEGLDIETTVRDTGLAPSPADVAVVHSILPGLAEKAGVDWSLALNDWSKDVMTSF